MRIRLDKLHHEPFVWQEELAVPLADLDRPEIVELGRIACRGELTPTDPGFLLHLELSYSQRIACDRCLQPTEESIECPLDLLVEEGRGEPAGEREEGTLRVEGGALETEPLVLEQLQLNVPMKPLCRPDCRGLCPSCGADLNSETCQCPPPVHDPRWAALAARLDRAAGNEN